MRKFNIINYEGKTEEEALDKCIKKENCSREDFIYKVTCVKGNLIKKKKYIISRDKESLKSAIKEMINNEEEFKNLSKENLERIKEWDWPKIANKYEEFFNNNI